MICAAPDFTHACRIRSVVIRTLTMDDLERINFDLREPAMKKRDKSSLPASSRDRKHNSLVVRPERQSHQCYSESCSSISEKVRSEERRVGKECRSRWSP